MIEILKQGLRMVEVALTGWPQTMRLTLLTIVMVGAFISIKLLT